MSMDRLAMLERMLEQKPDEPFVRYGLAMELRKVGRNDDSATAFAELVERHPDYVATYLMYGNLLAAQGHRDAAIEIYDKGIAAARAAGNDHAEGELETARAELG